MNHHWLVIGGVTALTAVGPSAARADEPGTSYSLGVSSGLGGIDVGDAHGTALALGLSGQLKLNTFHLSAEFEWSRASLADSRTGESHGSQVLKMRALAHLPLLYIDFEYDLGIALTAGIGVESIDFDQRSAVRRDFVTWGFDTVSGIKTLAVGQSRVDVDVGLRFDLARAPKSESKVRLPSCTGPCESPTLTAPIDVAFSVVLKLNWGPRS